MSTTVKVGLVATDDAREYRSACKQFGYRHRTSTPDRPQPNGIAERSVREAVEGSRTVMQQAGSPHRRWSRALRHYCFLYNVTKHPNGGLSPYEQRFGVAFSGPLLAFGSEVSYKSAVSEPN